VVRLATLPGSVEGSKVLHHFVESRRLANSRNVDSMIFNRSFERVLHPISSMANQGRRCCKVGGTDCCLRPKCAGAHKPNVLAFGDCTTATTSLMRGEPQLQHSSRQKTGNHDSFCSLFAMAKAKASLVLRSIREDRSWHGQSVGRHGRGAMLRGLFV
jgi:hypothetical protein